ncbi:MAG: ATP-binding protein [Gemmatimonadota bacterium]
MTDSPALVASDNLSPAPPVPDSLEDTGLSEGMLTNLMIKMLYSRGAMTGELLKTSLCIQFAILDEIMQDLQQRRLAEVRGSGARTRASYTFDLTAEGRQLARESLVSSGYVGPAPVPLSQYEAAVERQTVENVIVTSTQIREGFSHLVYDEGFLNQLGPAVNSGRSLFLYGHSGNGKTTIAEALAQMVGGDSYVPYAIEIEGQIMVLYDPVYHVKIEDDSEDGGSDSSRAWLREDLSHDQRYARIRRPVVFVGGELTLEQLDLQYDPLTKIYQAPPHVKANGGVFIIDDFGRQLVRPRDLLNRWMIPLEKRLDYLTFRNGHKFPVPFDCFLLFATNLNPLELVDEAFLRRIRYKIMVESPSYEQYSEIFQKVCDSRGLLFDPERVRYLFQNYYTRLQIPPRGCHPRDVVDTLCNVAKYEGIEPSLSIDLLDKACRSYFLDMPGGGSSKYLAGDEV